MIDAKTALALGIVNHVVPAAQLESEVKKLAQKIAQGPYLAIRAVKKELFARGEKDLTRGLDNEVQEQLRCYLSRIAARGFALFRTAPSQISGEINSLTPASPRL